MKMIEAKQAVQIAKQRAAEMLGQSNFMWKRSSGSPTTTVTVWGITLSFPRDLNQLAPIARLATELSPIQTFFD